MYQLVSAIAKPMGGDTRWEAVEIGNLTFPYLYATYSKIYAVLTNPYITGQLSLNLEDIRGVAGGLNVTFNDYLVSLGNKSLPTSSEIPSIAPKYAKWADGFHAGYTIQPIHPDYAWDIPLPVSDKKWLGLRKPGVDYDLFYKSCLVTVNGFFHMTDTDGLGISVIDGNKSNQMSRQNQLGILSFREVGELSFIPIKPEMVYKQNDRQFLKDRLYIDAGQNLDGKVVMLVFGGYLHVMDGSYYRVGDTSIAVDICNFSLLERIYESWKYIDLSSLGLEKDQTNEFKIDMEQLYSDEVLTAYASLSQSFIVLLDAENVFVERDQIERTPNPGSYISHERPVWPLVTGMGKMPEYWFAQEHPQWSINLHDSFSHNYNFFWIDQRKAQCLDNTRNTIHPTDVGRAFFLKIGREL